MSWGGYSSWSKTVLRSPFLVTPVRILWHSYREHCEAWGFDQSDATEFVHWLRGEEGVELKTGGQGRVRRVAIGIAPSMVFEDLPNVQNGKQKS